jgi:uncharacterized membrane protein HdeD (DUF308 family)
MTGEIKTGQRALAVMGDLVPVLGLLVFGYPLSQATIRTFLHGWVLVVVAITQFISRRQFPTAGSAVTVTHSVVRTTDCGRYR